MIIAVEGNLFDHIHGAYATLADTDGHVERYFSEELRKRYPELHSLLEEQMRTQQPSLGDCYYIRMREDAPDLYTLVDHLEADPDNLESCMSIMHEHSLRLGILDIGLSIDIGFAGQEPARILSALSPIRDHSEQTATIYCPDPVELQRLRLQ